MSKKKRREIPRFKTPIIETHCHLDYLQGDQLTETLDQARDVGVEKIITIAVSPDNLDTVKALANSACFTGVAAMTSRSLSALLKVEMPLKPSIKPSPKQYWANFMPEVKLCMTPLLGKRPLKLARMARVSSSASRV